MRLTDFTTLTFDCYGTLIDWETGIHTALEPLLAKAKTKIGREEALVVFARHETRQEVATPTMLYSDVLTAVYGALAKDWDVAVTEAEMRRFGQSVGDWPAFPDSAEALRYLKKHYKLVILSNVDRASFSGSNKRLGVAFDAIYTAQDIGTYKPSPANFAYLLTNLAKLGIAKGQILHTAQSLFHDHVPGKEAGLATAWIDRRHNTEGWGATMPPPKEAKPDFHFTSMADLVRAHRAELSA